MNNKINGKYAGEVRNISHFNNIITEREGLGLTSPNGSAWSVGFEKTMLNGRNHLTITVWVGKKVIGILVGVPNNWCLASEEYLNYPEAVNWLWQKLGSSDTFHAAMIDLFDIWYGDRF